jgi:CRP-like cAMP-binding protein
MDIFPASIEQFKNRPQHEIDAVMARSKMEQLLQGSTFLSAGQVSHRAGLIIDGVVRIFNINEKGEERTLGFAAEGDFIIDIESFRDRKPSLRNWEAITPVKILIWEREDMKWIGVELPAWTNLMSSLVQKTLYNRTLELFEMLEDNATTRYVKFTQRYPHILPRVSLRHVANYLGIAPQSLSRIRQQLTGSDRKINK